MKEIHEILQKHNFHMDPQQIQSIESAIIRVTSSVFYSKSQCKDPRLLICELQQLKRRRLIQNKIRDPEFQKHLSEILGYPGFHDSGEHVTYNMFIPPSMVAFDSDNYRVLDSESVRRLMDLGYGIKTFWIEKNDKVRNVYCTGKHPNLNPLSKSFCIGHDILDKPFSLETAVLIIDSLSCFNLSDTFLEDVQRNEIMEAIDATEIEKKM